ncbi:MAG: aspartyl/asparaginyl beta-hydroxylase domain-containing protein [Arenicella sp.]|nr:aspartyl/asparaginyl beta-hydroxylase domain-containing protein [Arenicella sp.]
MKLDQPFIRLPFRFDVDRLKSELDQLEGQHWMAHPNRIRGNAAIALVSRNGENNDDFIGHMKVTPHLQRCDYMQQVMASFGEVLARSRLMRLAAKSEVSEHVDFNYHWYSRVRIHIPITTNPDVLFYCGDEKINMRAGECWIFDSWRRHKVVNNSSENRVHLVIDTSGSSRFWRMLRRMQGLADEIVSVSS